MNKKCFICFLLCLAVILSLCACNSETAAPKLQQDTTTQPTPEESSTPGNNHSIPPHIVHFDTLAGIKEFFTQEGTNHVNSTFSPSAESIYRYETASTATQYADSISSLCFPVANSLLDTPDLVLQYTPLYQTLDIFYYVDNIQYGFFYYFDEDGDWYYGEVPAFSDVQVGPYTADFYPLINMFDRTYLIGHISINGIDIAVRIQGDGVSQLQTLSFEMFDFVPFSSIGGNVTA